jgi:hypothetical protein
MKITMNMAFLSKYFVMVYKNDKMTNNDPQKRHRKLRNTNHTKNTAELSK